MWPEVADPVANVNDDAEHALFVERAVDAIRDGENPIDLWVPQVELGFPEFLLYQHGAHVLVAALDVALPGHIDPRRLFDLVRWILMVTFPLTVFWSLRRIGIGPVGAAVAGALAALLSGSHRYGFEYDSYVWRGLGLFTQLLGMHLLFIAFALLHDVLTRGRHVFAAAIACAALVLTHLIYAYMLAVTVIPLFLGTVTRVNLRANTLRLAAVGGIALVLSSYMWLPFLRESAFLNVSPYLGREKYDSFGAPTILGWLVSGDLFDHGRLPIFTVLVALGVLAALVTRRRTALLVLGLFALWLVLYFGRPTLGPVADLLPMSQGLLFHRFIGGVDLFAIILAGIGVDWLWRVLRVDASRLRFALGAAVLVLLLVPALGERWGYYADNTTWLQQTRDAIARDQDAAIVLGALAQQPPGRAYAGLRSNWGQSLSFGLPFNSVRLYNLLVAEGRDAVAPPYRGASLNSDLLFDFNDQNLGEYALFDVEYVIAPPSVALPSALVPLVRTPTLILYRAPGGGYAEYASVSSRVAVATQTDLFPRMRGWLNSDAPGRRDFVRFDFPAKATPPDGWMATSRCPNDGVITYQRVEASRIDATAECLAASTLVFKLTYNPNWTVTVDGRSVATYMVSPSLLAVDLPAGRHAVSATYRSGPLKAPLLGLGALTLLAMAGVTLRQRRPAMAGLVVRARQAPWLAIARWRDVREALAARPRLADALTGVALTLPALLFAWLTTSALAFNNGLGDDGTVYARMVTALRDHVNTLPAPPWVYRVFPVWLVAMSRLDVKTGFVLLNVLSALGSGALLFRFLLREGLDRQRAALAVLWWSILPLGIRWIFFYPAIPDMFGFFLLTALIVNAVERRYLLFALLLPIGVLSRENLAMLVPFLWLITFRAEGWRRGTAITLAVAALGVAAFFLVRAFPPIVPADVYPNWLAAHRIDVNISRITQNIDGGAWRLLLAAPLSLGLLVVIPMLRWRHGLALLRMRVEWLYFVVATVAVTIIGGWDDDRYLFSLTPLLLLLTFGDRGVRWSPAGRIIALTVLQLVMVRFAWPVSGAQQHDYFQYTVAFMDQSRMWSLAALALGVAVLATLLMMLPKTRTTLPPGSVR